MKACSIPDALRFRPITSGTFELLFIVCDAFQAELAAGLSQRALSCSPRPRRRRRKGRERFAASIAAAHTPSRPVAQAGRERHAAGHPRRRRARCARRRRRSRDVLLPRRPPAAAVSKTGSELRGSEGEEERVADDTVKTKGRT